LPDEYIAILEETKNHSLAMHHNDYSKYHDILIVNKNIIFSDLKFHDGYAIKADEGNLYQFNRNGNNRTITDNNGYTYTKIGDNISKAHDVAEIFVIKIVFESLLKQNIGVSIHEDKIIIPFLYFFTGEDAFSVGLDDLFFEKGASVLLLYKGNREYYFTLCMLTDGTDYIFYETKLDDWIFSYKAEYPFFQFNLNNDKEILLALTGLNENINKDFLNYLDSLTSYEKRKIINAMFALNGYSFITNEWKYYFNQYSWYKPNKNIQNDRKILNIRQQKLLDFLHKS
jgi:hypothetical protein